MTQPASVTILMPVYNRARALQAVMPSYLNQAYVDKIVLVDDGSTDDTPGVMAAFQAQSPIPIEIIRHPRKMGQPQARLTALDAAKTEWVLFGEDDVVLAPNYLATLLRQAKKLHADLIAGRLVNLVLKDMTFELAQLPADDTAISIPAEPGFDFGVFRADFHARPPQPCAAPFLHTVTLIRRTIFQKVSFDPSYKGNAIREETDFYLGAAALGFSMYFTPDTACYHLRGPIASTGGQRMSRLGMEYWNLVNTRKLVTKHWAHLQHRHGFQGSPTTWMLGYLRQRYSHVLRHIIRNRSLRPKDRS